MGRQSRLDSNKKKCRSLFETRARKQKRRTLWIAVEEFASDDDCSRVQDYRSPKREEASHSDGGVPSLCSSNCDNLREAPSMISCSEGETTSPLTEESSPSKVPKNDVRNFTFSPRPNEGTQYEKVSDPMCVKMSSLYLSISNSAVEQTSKKTPTRSPLKHQLASRRVEFFCRHVLPRRPRMPRLLDLFEWNTMRKNPRSRKVRNGNERWQRRRILQSILARDINRRHHLMLPMVSYIIIQSSLQI